MGGFVLVALIVLMTTLSIIGRTINKTMHSDFAISLLGSLAQKIIDLGVGEINGNYEILEAGVGLRHLLPFFPILASSMAAMRRWMSSPRPCHCAVSMRVLRGLLGGRSELLQSSSYHTDALYRRYLQRYIGNGETTFFLANCLSGGPTPPSLLGGRCRMQSLAVYCRRDRASAMKPSTGRSISACNARAAHFMGTLTRSSCPSQGMSTLANWACGPFPVLAGHDLSARAHRPRHAAVRLWRLVLRDERQPRVRFLG